MFTTKIFSAGDLQRGLKVEITDDMKRAACPIFTPKGWRWKKYFRKYRVLRDQLNESNLHWWMNGGYEEWRKMEKEIINRAIDQQFLKAFPPISVKMQDATFAVINPGHINPINS